MGLLRGRYAVVGVFFGTSIALLLACSDARPPIHEIGSSDGGVRPPDVDGSVYRDGAVDGDAGADADAEPFSQPCLDDTPAYAFDAGSAAPNCPAGSCATHCANIIANYKLGLAQVAVACLRELPDCSEVTAVRACVDSAMAAACVDSTSAAFCGPLVTACDPNAGGAGSQIDEVGCRTLVHGMSAGGRSVFGACIEAKINAGTCAAEVSECGDAIRE